MKRPFRVRPGGRVVLFDATCRMCCALVQFVMARDRNGVFNFHDVHSESGKSILARLNIRADPSETMVCVADGHAFIKTDAFLFIMGHLPFPWRFLVCFRWVPGMVRDWIYDRVARNRYRIMGKCEQCRISSAQAENPVSEHELESTDSGDVRD